MAGDSGASPVSSGFRSQDHLCRFPAEIARALAGWPTASFPTEGEEVAGP